MPANSKSSRDRKELSSRGQDSIKESLAKENNYNLFRVPFRNTKLTSTANDSQFTEALEKLVVILNIPNKNFQSRYYKAGERRSKVSKLLKIRATKINYKKDIV